MEKLVCSLGKSLENSGNFFSYPVDAECHKKSCSDCHTIQNHWESAELSSRHSIIDCKNCTRHFFAWPSAACCTVQWPIHTCYYSSVENVYILHCFQDITVSIFTLLLVMWNHSSAIYSHVWYATHPKAHHSWCMMLLSPYVCYTIFSQPYDDKS